jgi:hypothetical protein
MAKLSIAKGTTSKVIQVFIPASNVSTGAGLTGLNNATAGLTLYYIREGDATPTAVTLSAGTVGTWSSGGFKEVDATNMPGHYQIGLPNAMLAAGAWSIGHLQGAANMAPVPIEIDLGVDQAILTPAGNIRSDGTGMSWLQFNKFLFDAITSVVNGASTTTPTIDKNGATLGAVTGGKRMGLTSDANGARSGITVDPAG